MDDDEDLPVAALAEADDDEDNDEEDMNADGPAGDVLMQVDEDDEEDGANDDDDEDEDEEEDEEEEEEEDDDEEPDDVLEGGVAEPVEDGARIRSASAADITLFLTFSDCPSDNDITLDPDSPFVNHPVLKAGVTVQIGLDKNTKLSAVFKRYCDVCNEHASASAESGDTPKKVSVHHLEFVHVQQLNSSDTPEAAALMKHDRITVRRERSKEREHEQDYQRMQRDSDKAYFDQMRRSLPYLPSNSSNKVNSDICILDCQGMIQDENGKNQPVFSTTIRCHISIMRTRCGWMKDLIEKAKVERKQKLLELDIKCREEEKEFNRQNSVVTVPDTTNGTDQEETKLDDGNFKMERDDTSPFPMPAASAVQRNVTDGNVLEEGVKETDDEDNILHIEPQQAGAAQIENDEDDHQLRPIIPADDDVPADDHASFVSTARSETLTEPLFESSGALAATASYSELCSSPLHIILAEHSPEAVKLLLEYCYTNRVIPLGLHAFVDSCKTPKPGQKKPVPPFPTGSSAQRRWPNRGEPSCTFYTCIALLKLAEEAQLPRLSLMAEIAAAQLVTLGTVTDALLQCQAQVNSTGNSLPRLRQAAMKVVLQKRDQRGVFVMPSFRRALQDRCIIPTLLLGTMDACDAAAETKKRKRSSTVSHSTAYHNPNNLLLKRDWQLGAFEHFEAYDRDEKSKRERERRKRRTEKWEVHMQPDGRVTHTRKTSRAEADEPDQIINLASSYEDNRFLQENKKRSLRRMQHHLGGSLAAAARGARQSQHARRSKTHQHRRSSR